MDIIESTVRKLGISHCYTGYKQLLYLLTIMTVDEQGSIGYKKELYAKTALYFDCKATTIERNIRTLSARAWRINPAFLSSMFDTPIFNAPSSAQFISALSAHILKELHCQS